MTRRGRLIAVEGHSAAGKSTLVRAAAEQLGWLPLAEAFDRLDPAPSLEFSSPRELLLLERQLLAEEARRYREALRNCERGSTVLADTGFLGPITYTRALVDLGRAPEAVWQGVLRSARPRLRRGALGLPDLTFYLETTASARARRARADPDRHPAAVFPRHEAVGEVERSYFEDAFPAARPGRFRGLRGGSSLRSQVASISTIVAELDPRPATRADALALLSLLEGARGIERGRNPGPNR